MAFSLCGGGGGGFANCFSIDPSSVGERAQEPAYRPSSVIKLE